MHNISLRTSFVNWRSQNLSLEIQSKLGNTGVVAKSCSVRKVFLEIHRKTPVSESLSLQLYQTESLGQVFCYDFYEISKNTFSEHLRWQFLETLTSHSYLYFPLNRHVIILD